MAWIEFNNNPVGRRVGDCAVRAVSRALDTDWENAYLSLVMNGYAMGDMPSSDSVWGATLRQHGFTECLFPTRARTATRQKISVQITPRAYMCLALAGTSQR